MNYEMPSTRMQGRRICVPLPGYDDERGVCFMEGTDETRSLIGLLEDGESANCNFRLLAGDEVLEDYWLWYPDALHKISDAGRGDPHRYCLSPKFTRTLLTELTTIRYSAN